jgi:hypothetical protein
MHDAMYVHADVEAGIPADVKINSCCAGRFAGEFERSALHVYKSSQIICQGEKVFCYIAKKSAIIAG